VPGRKENRNRRAVRIELQKDCSDSTAADKVRARSTNGGMRPQALTPGKPGAV
jgi:hypothetical protein